jgi:predicted enzyme involved in methoxymalonyl-ACP biosynthesis
MKNDIEGNIESIVQDVDESTFEQCFQSYRERIEELNHISTLNLEEIKKEFQNIKNDTFKAFKNDLDIALS